MGKVIFRIWVDTLAGQESIRTKDQSPKFEEIPEM